MNYRKSYSDIGKLYLESKLNENAPMQVRQDPREADPSRDPFEENPLDTMPAEAVIAFEELTNALKNGRINIKSTKELNNTITLYTGGEKPVVIQVLGFE